MRCDQWNLHRCAAHADEYGEQAIKDGALRVNCYPRLRGAA